MGSDRARLPFFDMPSAVVTAINARVDGEIISARNASGGFSPGPASVCTLRDGRRVFVKACSPELNDYATTMHRREAEVLAALPDGFPSPGLLATVDVDGWFAIVTQFIDGTMPADPFEPETATETVERVLGVVTLLAEAGKECSIDVVAPMGTDERERDGRTAWRRWAKAAASGSLNPWISRNLKELEALESVWDDAASGTALLHRDLRTDNMLLTATGGVAVDWPCASTGAPWVDLVGLLPALTLSGGPDPVDVFESHPVGRAAEPAAVNSYLAAITGYFISQSGLPPPATVSGLRQFQAAQGRICQTWLSHRLGWDPD